MGRCGASRRLSLALRGGLGVGARGEAFGRQTGRPKEIPALREPQPTPCCGVVIVGGFVSKLCVAEKGWGGEASAAALPLF